MQIHFLSKEQRRHEGFSGGRLQIYDKMQELFPPRLSVGAGFMEIIVKIGSGYEKRPESIRYRPGYFVDPDGSNCNCERYPSAVGVR